MAGAVKEDEEVIADINVTPLVDVMLVLLIIFMVTATYIAQRAIPVSLPKASTGEDKGQSKNIAFAIDSQANLYINGERIDFSDIPTRIEIIKAGVEDKDSLNALITADEAVSHGVVVKLIDSVRKAGVNEFAINVESVEPVLSK